jgi:ferredoxin
MGEAAGVPLPAGCRSGQCGQCAVRLVAGQVRYPQPPTAPLDPGWCLTCVAEPQGDVTLDA